jgi:hypothetical protein
MKLLLSFLFIVSCRAEIVVDPSQVFETGGVPFHWIFEPDYGYQPIDYDGRIVSGLTDGAIVWLIDDSPGTGYTPPAPYYPPNPAPPIPGPKIPTSETPEPETFWVIFAIVFASAVKTQKDNEK